MNEPLLHAAAKPAKFICILLFVMLLVTAITAFVLQDYQITITATVVAAYTLSVFVEIMKRDFVESLKQANQGTAAPQQHVYSDDI
ncbi:hypothetical protein JD969_13965 [Planctomycetota bacterium]|nr:hypothetical protein JD969_13965 [Planctomycetota bacterium]